MSEEREIRNSPLGLRVLPSLKAALEQAAKDDNRSTSSMAEIILATWLKEKGYLANK